MSIATDVEAEWWFTKSMTGVMRAIPEGPVSRCRRVGPVSESESDSESARTKQESKLFQVAAGGREQDSEQ